MHGRVCGNGQAAGSVWHGFDVYSDGADADSVARLLVTMQLINESGLSAGRFSENVDDAAADAIQVMIGAQTAVLTTQCIVVTFPQLLVTA